MNKIKAGLPIPKIKKQRNWEALFLVSYILLIMLYGAFHIGRNYERGITSDEQERAFESGFENGYEDGFTVLADEVRSSYECVEATDACLHYFEDLTDY